MPKSHIIPPVSQSTTSFTGVSLFSGCGGFCEGIEQAGIEVKVAVELDKYACETYRHNFPRTPLFAADIHQFLTPDSNHRKDYKLSKGIDIVFGGPPCQGFSQIGARRPDDERNELYKQYARVVEELRPRLFLMENVPNLAMMNKGHFKKVILEEFAALGYSNTVMLKISADDFGVPQTRQRVIFIGTRDEDEFPFELASFCERVLKKLKVAKAVTVDQAIADLPMTVVHSGEVMDYPEVSKPSAYMKEMRIGMTGLVYSKSDKRRRAIGKNQATKLYNHHTKEIQERRANLIALLEPGKKADSLPKHIWDNKRPEKWRRLHPDRPSHTILAQMHRDLSEWVHPRLNRWITVREAARLQSFHDGFVFQGSEWQQLKQIGNAVPPLMAYALGQLAKEVLVANQHEQDTACEAATGDLVQQVLMLA
ncbi:DNA (cytosine-5)-methyltransferase 1 [Andreprevotia lacus DSM 23236]|jgi:DNA (cytosine-5)-methyltransferase 1|uniref:Cytosine-specific methyltransferase n=1 Tax=Andreprevotia lacus DSM 23236 TaxID=1121001 RepID=A0A1W1Y110_9NEIS|nr:DNA cytosine methyltransferase [Andreprevotia lacus]SMC29846.1 DNA (cytosine-5)-methyltransferase 1 [Andreprevotia lacus DSM 23236]